MLMLSQWLADGNQPQRRILLLGESLATAYVRLSKVLWSLTPASGPHWSLQGCPTYRACPMPSAADSWANRLEANFGKKEVAHLWEQDAYATSVPIQERLQLHMSVSLRPNARAIPRPPTPHQP